MGEAMRAMSDEKFENHKNAVRMKKMQKPLTLSGQFWQYHREISSQQYHFNRPQVEASMLKGIKLEDVCGFFEVNFCSFF
jgi:secreted Zn-dependent insulinase-like peptidase